MKTKAKAKGFVIEAFLKDGTSHSLPGVSTFAEAVYKCRRYINHIPDNAGVQITVNGKCVYHYAQGEETIMARLSTINEQTRNMSHDGEYLPFLDGKGNKEKGYDAGPGKDWLAASALAFTIKNPRIKESTDERYADSIQYDIYFSVESTDYKYQQRRFNIQPAYTLSLPSNEQRIAQMEAFGDEYMNDPYPIILTKKGRYFLLEEAEMEQDNDLP